MSALVGIKEWAKKIKLAQIIVAYIKSRVAVRNVRLVRNNYRRVVNKLSSQGGKIKIYFLITQKQLWSSSELYILFKDSGQFDPIAIIFPNYEDEIKSPGETFLDNKKFFSDIGVSAIDGWNSCEDIINPENVITQNGIIFFDQPWPHLGNEWTFKKLSKNHLICYIPYGFKIANNYAGHFSQEIHNLAWKIFTETPWHKQKFVELSIAKGENTAITGYPKLDAYLNSSRSKSNREVNSILEKAGGRKIIIWAPHWSMHDGLLNYSTFDLFYNDFASIRNRRKDLFFIFKPHQRLRQFTQETELLSAVQVNDYYNEWMNSENSTIYNEADYIELFKSSTAMITDSGSFLAEYLPSKNPLLILKSHDSVGYNELGESLVANYYQATNWSDVEMFLESVVDAGLDPLRVERLKFLNEIWDPEMGSSSERISQHIVKCIFNRGAN